MKDAWNSAQNILSKVLTAFTVCILIFTMISVMFFEKNDRSLFGFKFFTVLSDSMAATDFSAGDLIIAKKIKDPALLVEGDIISFISQNSESFGQVVTHKIRMKTTDSDGDPGFITYGTTTGNDDQAVVTYPYILGKYVGRIPKLGMFVTFQKQPIGYIISIALPFLIIIAYQAMNCFVLFKQYQLEQMGYVKADQVGAGAQGGGQNGAGGGGQGGPNSGSGTQQNMGGQGYNPQGQQWQGQPGAQGYGPGYGYAPGYGPAPGYGYPPYGAPGYGAAGAGYAAGGYADPEKAELMAELNALKAQIDRQEKDQIRAELAELRAMLEKQAGAASAAPASAPQQPAPADAAAADAPAAEPANPAEPAETAPETVEEVLAEYMETDSAE